MARLKLWNININQNRVTSHTSLLQTPHKTNCSDDIDNDKLPVYPLDIPLELAQSPFPAHLDISSQTP